MKSTQIVRLTAMGLLLGLIFTTACQKELLNVGSGESTTLADVDLQSYTLDFDLSGEFAGKQLLGARAIFRNMLTGQRYIVNAQSTTGVTAQLPRAPYKVEISGYIRDIVNGREQNRRVSVTKTLSPTFRSTSGSPLLLRLSSNPYADLKIEEIYFAGSGSSIRDQYFKITNTANVPVLADGMVITEGSFLNTTYRVYTPNILDSAFAVNAIWRVPIGEDFEIDSMGSMSLVNQAQNHTGGLNLLNVNFEWFNPTATNDIDNDTIQNLEVIFSYTKNIWVLHNRGYKSYAIGHLGVDTATYLANYKYAPTYPRPGDTTGTNPMVVTNTYAFPLSWIADGVNLSPIPNWEWNTLYNTVDSGYTGMADDNTRFGKSVKRRRDSLNYLIDTDNSTNDFTYGGGTALGPW